jgi:septal ring factor EnvC (AmiA/AmiB activator)
MANLKAREKQRQQVQNAISAVIRREREEAMRREREEAAKRKAADDAAKKANNGAEPAAPPVAANKPVTRTPRVQSVLENTPEGLISSQKFEENRGKLPWPVDRGLISLRYGVNQVPGKTRSIDVISDGISIETEVGTQVKAICDGEVSSVFNIGDKQTVMVKHGKYFTTYSNLQSTAVRRGAKVTAGQVIGAAGANDDGVGEVQLRVDTETSTLNPEQWIRRK